MSLSEEKEALRARIRLRRKSLSEAERDQAALGLLAAWRGRFDHLAPRLAVSAFWPNPSEIDCRPLLDHLHGRGHPLLLPVVIARDSPLIFRRWTPGDDLVRGNGAHVPRDDAPQAEPDFLLVPLTAFDRSGYRLGQGAGYYDRTLAGLRARRRITAVGVAFAIQEVERVPFDGYDQRLEGVLTETGFIATGEA
jgi:5-formyltetrahydrofolate cyclo-ligase